MTVGAAPARRSYAGEALQRCGKARQTPLGAPLACGLFPPTSALPVAAPPQPTLPVPSLRGPLSDRPRTPTNANQSMNLLLKHQRLLKALTCLTWSHTSSHCLSFFLASSKSLKRRARSPLPVADARLLKTGDGVGEKLPLTKSQMLLAPPFKPGRVTKPVR